MTESLQPLLVYPTVVYTILLGAVLLYWMLGIVGLLGHDMLDMDGDADLDLDADGALDGDADADGDADGHGLAEVLEALGLGAVPLTVSASFVVLWSWVASIVLNGWASGLAIAPLLRGTGVFAVSLLLGILAAAICVRPMRGLFVTHKAREAKSLVGRSCTIVSGRVDGKFGQATFADGGAGLLLNVVCETANALKKGDTAVIVSHDPVKDLYEVEPVPSGAVEQLGGAERSPAAAAALRDSRRV